MATVDEGVVNLQRFIGLLVSATSATRQVGDHVEEASRRFAELDGEAEQEGGGLNDELTRLASTLEAEEAEAVAAIGDLTQAAADAQDTAGQVQDRVEQAATDLDEKAGAVENGLEQASARLVSEGFQPLGQSVDEAEQELDAASLEEDQAFTELEGAISGFLSEAEAAWSDAESEMDEAATDLSDAETEIETESTEGVQAFETAARTLETACTDLEGDVDVIYDVLGQGVEAQGQAWLLSVQIAAHEALTFLTESRKQRLEQPAATVKDEALAAVHQEYEALDAVLNAAATSVSGLEPLAEDLVKCRSILGEIDALMDALAS